MTNWLEYFFELPINRREFLRQSASIMAGATITPSVSISAAAASSTALVQAAAPSLLKTLGTLVTAGELYANATVGAADMLDYGRYVPRPGVEQRKKQALDFIPTLCTDTQALWQNHRQPAQYIIDGWLHADPTYHDDFAALWSYDPNISNVVDHYGKVRLKLQSLDQRRVKHDWTS